MKTLQQSYSKTMLIIASLSLMVACGPTENRRESHHQNVGKIKTGGSKLISIDGKYKVWTKKVGEGKIKVLLLHGGPGFSHDYFECFEDFLPKENIEFYYYDQLGSGNSDVPTDTTLWNTARFVEEVEQVRKGLGLENFYILGHSWGSLLAMEYLNKYQKHVKGAVLSNMTGSIDDFINYSAVLKSKLFTSMEKQLFDSLDRAKAYSSPRYTSLLNEKLYTKVICRMPLEQWPEPLMRAFKKPNQSVYLQMQGIDEFHVTGNLLNWDFWDKMPRIKVPTLVLGGVYDEMDPESMKREAQLIPNSRLYLCPEGSHMSMYDDQSNYFNSLVGFLKDVDADRFVADKKL
ncbi:proline iminopeptidase-family hydrolase [Pedobacter aquatilis]|uniref:proline iminopeptidase-family hydrolase n=1 Tax=Pedobacter aquatilis TaxID=351343 RepID=UPI0025B3AD19|nr:proline iminopeptidase-family hydrolase [Pedobacter aquatilis]MDN3588662.1 proline iminopeptidase-family hydrolase [Pedobacter aquatilis]